MLTQSSAIVNHLHGSCEKPSSPGILEGLFRVRVQLPLSLSFSLSFLSSFSYSLTNMTDGFPSKGPWFSFSADAGSSLFNKDQILSFSL